MLNKPNKSTAVVSKPRASRVPVNTGLALVADARAQLAEARRAHRAALDAFIASRTESNRAKVAGAARTVANAKLALAEAEG